MHPPTSLHCWKRVTVLSIGLLLALFSHTVFAAYDTDSLEGYWKLDETSGTAVYDSSGHNQTGTATGTPTISSDIPTLNFTNNRSLDFDGTSDYVTMGDVANLEVEGSVPFSISTWFNPNSSPGAEETFVLVSKGTPAGKGYAFQYEQISSNYVINISKYGVVDQRVTISELTTGTWYHLVGVQRSSEIEYYIDGSSVGTYSNSSAYNASATDEFRLGAAHDGTLKADGLLDDVRVYSRALSGSEITALAAGNHTTAIWDGSSSSAWETAANWDITAVPDPFTHIIIPEQTGGAELSASVSGASLTIEHSGFTGAYVDLHGHDFEFVESGELKGGGTLRLLGSETINATTIGTTSTGTVLYYGTGSYSGLVAGNSYYSLTINDGLLGYWDMDVQEGSNVRDISGNDHDATRATTSNDPSFSSTVAPTAFFNRYSLEFDGDDYSSIKPDVFDELYRGGNGGFTVSLWQKTTATSNSGDNDKMLLGIEGGYNNGWSLYYDANDAHPSVNFTSDYSNRLEATGATTYDGDWHHIAATYSNGSARIFVDGNPIGSSSQTLYDITGESTETRIGYAVDTASYFPGFIDELRVYKRPLADHEIAALAAGHMPATASGSFTLDASVDANSDLTLASGLLDVSGSNYHTVVGGSWLNYGGQFNSRGGIVELNSASSDKDLFSGGQQFNNLLVSGAGSWNLRDLLDADGYISLTGGELDVTTNNYSVHAYDFDQGGGTFTPRSGVVVLNGSSDVSVTITDALNELQIEDPTEDGLIAYWKFDECQTDTTADSSGNSQTGTLNGPAVWTGSGLPSSIDFDNQCALSFDGSGDQFVESASNSTLTGNATFSIALWFYVPTGADTSGTYGRFIDWGNATSGASAQMSVYSNTTNQLFVGHWATGQASSTTFTNDEWHHAVWVREGGSNNGHQGNTLYLDGVEIPLDIDVSTAKIINVAADKYDIGGRGSGNLSVECTLDDVRVYDRVLTPIEVRRLAQGRYAEGTISTATVTFGGNLDLDTMTILSGKASAGSRTIDVSGDWNNYAGSGSFIEGTSTVDLDGSSTQNVRGSTEFYNFEISTNSAQTVNFGSGTTQYITNALTLAGAASNVLTLSPLTAAIEWFLDLGGSATQSVSYVSPSYSNASPGETITATSSTDGGNNTNWTITAPTADSSSSNGGWLSNKQARERIQAKSVPKTPPTLSDVGIADQIIETVATTVGGILDKSMRTAYEPSEISRRVQQVAAALADRFHQGITQFRLSQQQSQETLKTSAPSLDDTQRKLLRAERTVADRSLTQLTASAIGEKRGLLVAVVKSEQVVFADVPVDSWFAPFISVVIEEDIATGYEDVDGKPTGEFGVTNAVTYAEMLKMALQSASIELTGGSPRNVSAQGTWASSYAAQAEEMSLDVFGADRDVHSPATRAEVIHTLLEVLGLPIAPNAVSPFTDLPDTHPYAKSIATASLYGLISGDTGSDGNTLGTVRPDDTINRAEVAKTIALLQKLFE